MLRPAGGQYRTAERVFRERVGVSPKQLAKVIRFKHAYTALNQRPARTRSAVTPLDFGYYDASHFAKDFRAFTGSSPGRFLREDRGFSTDINRFCLDVELNHLDTREAEQEFSTALHLREQMQVGPTGGRSPRHRQCLHYGTARPGSVSRDTGGWFRSAHSRRNAAQSVSPSADA